MPLLRRQPFEHEKPPPDLQPEDEVFYCDITNEIFTDYEAFFERIILCNSLVWSCTITGRSGLTYQEAIECEKKATRNLETFPTTLQKPLLFLASCTHRGRLADMNDDVFIFGKDRFFKGESVDAFLGGMKKSCKVIDVIAPAGKEKENKPDENVIVIEDSDEDSPPKEQFQTLHPKQYKYVVQIVGKKSTQTVRPNKISRKKGLFTRDKVKLFLKHHSDPDDVTCIWKLKDDVVKKFQMANYRFQDFFSGPLPAFVMTESKKKKKMTPNVGHPVSGSDSSMSHTPKYKDDKKKKKEKVSPPQPQPVAPEMTQEEREALREKYRLEKLEERMVKKEELRKKMEEERIKRKQERDKERERQKEEKRLQVEMLKEWSRPREDLECDDLKMLPETLPVNVKLPQELFGEALMVLEFVHNFKHMLDIKQFFPSRFSYEVLENALLRTDVDGYMSELIQMMLIAIFTLQLEEEEEESEAEKQRKKDGPNVEMPDIDEDMLTSDISTNQLIQTATAASSIPFVTHGSSLRRMQVDSFVLTELVRLHFLASGAKTNAKDAKWRYQQRGGYTPLDDPGLELRRQDPVIIRSLASENLFDLTPGAKLRLVMTLINQFLTYATSRDYLEDNYEKLRQVRMDLKQLQWAEVRREKEASASRYKRRMEERAKIREKQNEIRLQKIKEREEQMKAEDGSGDPKNMDSEVKPVNGINGEISPAASAGNTPPKSDDCPTLEEIAAREEKEKEEEAQKKEEFQVEERKILDNIMALQHGNAVYPLGRDRFFRKYWIFRGLPGLYIEDNDETITEETLMSLACINTGWKKSENNSLSEKGVCNKENVTVNIPNGLDATSQDSKQSAGSDCIVISDSDSLADPDRKDEEEDMREDEPPQYNMVAVEQIKNRTFSNWSVIRTQSQFQTLLDSLNVRGHREGPLKQALLEQRSLLLDSISKCPIYLLNSEAANEEEKEAAIKKTTGRWGTKIVLPESKFATAQDELEHSLRENILDTEERIFGGTLGHLKVEDRFAWREAIFNGIYDPQTNDPQFAKSEKGTKMEIDDEDDDDDMSTQGSVTEESAVKDLNKALIQVGRCVDPRYLNVPLGEKESAKKARLKKEAKEQELKQKKKENDDDNSEDEEKPEVKPEKKTAFERWEDSLLYATSFSQVFLHLMTLEKSIAWSKSALHARCKICRRKGEPDKMLLCDSCDRGHHMYCLKPPLEKVPMGEWYCPSCRPKEIKRSPRKERRRTFSQEEEEEEEEEEEGSNEEDSDEGEFNEDSSEAEEEEEEEFNNENVCSVCNETGVLVCCDGCPLSYHLYCAKPELKKVPKAKWMCQKCTGYEKKGKIKLVKPKGGRKPKTTPKSQKSTPTSSQAGSRHASPVTVSKGSRKRKNSQSDNETPKTGKTSRKTGRHSIEPDNDLNDGKKHYTSTSRCNAKAQDMKVCEDIVLELLKHDDVWPFLKPVSKRLVPDYFDIVKKPMDFSTVKNKMNKYQYTDVASLISDVRQIFINCDAYNQRKTDEFKAGATLSKLFEKRLKDHGLQDLCSPSGKKKSKKS